MNSRIQKEPYISKTVRINSNLSSNHHIKKSNLQTNPTSPQILFKGNGGDMGKKGWLWLLKLSDSMKEITEVTNALIAAIGTGIIAPIIIMCSPGKGDQEDKDKKFFQALRQPLSAALALGFQLPATYGVNWAINNLAYDKTSGIKQHEKINKYIHKFFDDDVIGELVPDKNYIKKHTEMGDIEPLKVEFEETGSLLKQKLEEKIKKDYDSVGLEISKDDLAKQVEKEKDKFLFDELVNRKHKNLLRNKANELKAKNITIKDSDLVTEKLKLLIADEEKEALKKIEKEINLSPLDITAKWMGFETKKLKELKSKQDAFKVEKAIEKLRKDDPSIFESQNKKMEAFVEAQYGKAQKVFANKKFWISLFINLFMVTASCYALNWAHPRVKELLDRKKDNSQADNNKKVEVRA